MADPSSPPAMDTMADGSSPPAMEYRFLGQTGLQVSCMGLGCWLTYGDDVGEETAFACMKEAYDSGVNFFDTAEDYGEGDAEALLGEAIRKFGWKQNDLVISTKLSNGSANSKRPQIPLNNMGLSRKHIIEGMDYSLKRLGLPYVDIVYAHRPDRCTPMDEVVRAFNHLINNGKAFYWGTSEWDASEIMDAWRVADRLGLIGPAVEQPQYNLFERDRVEREYRWLYSTGLATFAPLKMGVLTGKYNDLAGPPAGNRFAESNGIVSHHYSKTFGDDGVDVWKARISVVSGLKPIADQLGCTLAQLSLAWILKNPRVSAMILGASRPEQLRENLAALDVKDKLTPDIMKQIEEVVKNKPKQQPMRFRLS